MRNYCRFFEQKKASRMKTLSTRVENETEFVELSMRLE